MNNPINNTTKWTISTGYPDLVLKPDDGCCAAWIRRRIFSMGSNFRLTYIGACDYD